MESDKGIRWLLSAALSLLLASPPPALSVQPGQAGPAKPTQLKIVIVEGEGAINNIRQRVAREPIVEVQDENNRPVAGAVVTFLLPNSGPSGTFVNGSRMMTITTNEAGRAAATGIQTNGLEGAMQIRVTASYQGLTANATIVQTNAVAAAAGAGAGSAAGGAAAGGAAAGGAAGGISAAAIGVIVGVAAAAAVGAAVALGGGGNGGTVTPGPTPPTPTPTTITLGAGTVGRP